LLNYTFDAALKRTKVENFYKFISNKAKGILPIKSVLQLSVFSLFKNFPEVYEIWLEVAFIYMQESAGNNPGRCFAV